MLTLSLPVPLPHSWQSYVHTDGALEWRQTQLRQRAAEVSEALTELEQLHAGARQVPGVPLAGRLQLTGALAAGHSFGAVTAMVAAQVKARTLQGLIGSRARNTVWMDRDDEVRTVCQAIGTTLVRRCSSNMSMC